MNVRVGTITESAAAADRRHDDSSYYPASHRWDKPGRPLPHTDDEGDLPPVIASDSEEAVQGYIKYFQATGYKIAELLAWEKRTGRTAR